MSLRGNTRGADVRRQLETEVTANEIQDYQRKWNNYVERMPLECLSSERMPLECLSSHAYFYHLLGRLSIKSRAQLSDTGLLLLLRHLLLMEYA